MNEEYTQNWETEQQEHVELAEELSPILVPPKLYEFFIANGKEGLEAMQVWMHLVYTARRQKTNQVWANNTYIRQGLHMGERKVKQVKAWLHKHNLITYVQRQDEKTGKMEKTYIRVHACAQTAGAVTARADTRTTGYNTQMLETNKEMLEGSKQELTPANANEGKEEDIEESLDTLEMYGIKRDFARENVITAAEKGIHDFAAFYTYLHERKPDAGPALIRNMIADDDKINDFLSKQAEEKATKNLQKKNEPLTCPVCGYKADPHMTMPHGGNPQKCPITSDVLRDPEAYPEDLKQYKWEYENPEAAAEARVKRAEEIKKLFSTKNAEREAVAV